MLVWAINIIISIDNGTTELWNLCKWQQLDLEVRNGNRMVEPFTSLQAPTSGMMPCIVCAYSYVKNVMAVAGSGYNMSLISGYRKPTTYTYVHLRIKLLGFSCFDSSLRYRSTDCAMARKVTFLASVVVLNWILLLHTGPVLGNFQVDSTEYCNDNARPSDCCKTLHPTVNMLTKTPPPPPPDPPDDDIYYYCPSSAR